MKRAALPRFLVSCPDMSGVRELHGFKIMSGHASSTDEHDVTPDVLPATKSNHQMILRLLGYSLVCTGFVMVVLVAFPSLKGSGLPFAPPEEYRIFEDKGEKVALRQMQSTLQEVGFFQREKLRKIFPPLLLMLVGAVLLDFSGRRKAASDKSKAKEASDEVF